MARMEESLGREEEECSSLPTLRLQTSPHGRSVLGTTSKCSQSPFQLEVCKFHLMVHGAHDNVRIVATISE